MAYLLIVPFGLYVALAAVIAHHFWRAISSTIMVAYTLGAALVTGCYLIMGTTSSRTAAEVTAVLAVLLSAWTIVILMPLTLVGLYFETWLRAHWRAVLLAVGLIAGGLAIVVLAWRAAAGYPLVVPVTESAWVPWILGSQGFRWPYSALFFVGSQAGCAAVIGWALYRRRLTLWRDAVPLTLVSALSVLIPLLSPVMGARWLATVAAAGWLPSVALLAARVGRAMRTTTLNLAIRTTLRTYSDGVAVLDAQDRVVWHNLQFARWLPGTPPPFVTPLAIDELLRGSALALVVRDLLDTGRDLDECVLIRDGEEYVLQVSVRPLDTLSDFPGARLIVLHDVTASRMRHDLQARSRELLALSAISADIASTLDLEQVITRALQQVLALGRSSGAAVYLLDEEGRGCLRLAGRLARTGTFQQCPAEFSSEQAPFVRALGSGSALLVEDAAVDQSNAALMAYFGVRAALIVPLIAREQTVGILVSGYPEPRAFDSLEVALFEGMARQLAVAIENARLHSQERQQRQTAEALREVASILASRNLSETLQLLLEKLHGLLTYERASIMVLAEPGYLRVGAAVGFVPSPDGTPITEQRVEIERYPYLKRLFEQRTPQLVLDTEHDRLWVPGEFPYRAWLGVPLLVRDRVLGCLSISHHQPGHYTPDDLNTAIAFANQAAVAIENALLFEGEQQRRIQAERLQEASYAVVTSPDLESALRVGLAHLAQAIPFDRAHVGLFEADQRWHFRAVHPPSEPLPLDRPISISNYPLVQRVISTRRAVLVPDTRQEPQWRPGRFINQEIRSWLGVPLVVRNTVIGLLALDSLKPANFSEEHLQLAQTYANQFAAAIENFRLLEEAQQQNRALSTLNRVLAASNEALAGENLLQNVLNAVLQTLDLPGGALHQRSASQRELILRAAHGLPEVVQARLQRLEVLPGGEVSLEAEPGWTFFSVPLLARGIENGLLSIYHPLDYPLDAALRDLLARIGQQLGVVLENAILFEDTMRRVTLTTDLGRLGLAISAQLDRRRVLSLLCEECLGIFNVQGAYLWLVQADALVGAEAFGPGAEAFQGHRLPLAEGAWLPVRVLDEWQPRYVNHLAESDALPPDFVALTGAKSALAIPLLKAEVPVGTLLLVDTHNPEAFSESVIEHVGMFGVQAALAIENASLFEEVRRRLDHLRLVNEVGRYSTAILTQSALVEGVASKLYDILGYDTIILLVMEEGRLAVRTVVAEGQPIKLGADAERYRPILWVAGQAIERSDPVLQNQQHPPIGAEAAEQRDYCALAVPLVVADEVIGVLVVERRGFASIGQEDLDVLEPLAAQLAIAVSNARLYERVREHAIDLEARAIERTARIREQQERTEAILRSVADAVIVFDLTGQIVLANPVARDLFERYGQDTNLSEHVGALVQRVMSPPDTQHDATELIQLNGVVLQAKAAQVMEGDALIGSVVVLRDISRLQELDRLKDRFISTVSHELRTPLANLKLYLQLLEKGNPERYPTYLDVMQREAQRLERLIDDLLQISRLQAEQQGQRRRNHLPTAIDEIIALVVQHNQPWAETEGKLLTYEHQGAPLPQVKGDADQLERALTNLVSNAIRYTPEGGRIVVRSRVEPAGQDGRDWVIIEVSDTGIGIPAHELPMIFDRFFRASNISPTVPGTGLGLSILKDIIEQHGGQVDVESREGQGSTFRLRLPAYSS